MRTTATAYDLDLSEVVDEELVTWFQETGFLLARNALMERYYRWTAAIIAAEAKRKGLPADDVADAQQNGVFAIQEAIRKYRAAGVSKTRGCRFRTYLRRVVVARFQDFHKSLKRRHCFTQLSTVSESWSHAEKTCGENQLEPNLLAELRRALDELGEKAHLLWEGMVQGRRLRRLAAELRISYDAIKRQRRRVLHQLKARLNFQQV